MEDLSHMLVIYKGNVVFTVALEEGAVRLSPVVGKFDNPQLLKALARNEELMVQAHLNIHQPADAGAAMVRYFEDRGWLVRRKGQTPPAGATGAWAES